MSRSQDRMQELHQKHVAPVEAAARRLFSSPDGQKVLAALERAFPGGVAFAVIQGAISSVDPYGTVVNAARADVINYLRNLAEGGQGGQA